MRKVPNGDFISLSNPVLWDYIEEGVADLVRVLIDLGFTPVGSCEGHEDDPKYKEIYVRLGFKRNQIDLKMKLVKLMLEAQQEGIRFHLNLFGPPLVVDHREIFEDFSIYVKIPIRDAHIHYANLVKFLQSKV